MQQFGIYTILRGHGGRAFNTVQVISRWVVGMAEETSTYSSLGFCTVNCRPTASNYQLSHLRPCGDRTPASERGGETVTTLPPWPRMFGVRLAAKCLKYIGTMHPDWWKNRETETWWSWGWSPDQSIREYYRNVADNEYCYIHAS